MKATADNFTALLIRIEDARRHPLFGEGVKAAYRACADILNRPQEEALMALRTAGGWTKVIRGAYDGVVKATTVHGVFNAVIPLRTVLNAQDIQDIRLEAQRRAQRRTA